MVVYFTNKGIYEDNVLACEACGYVYGEYPYQRCPMSDDKR